MKKSDYVVIGKLGKPFGIKGWLKVLSYMTIGDEIFDYDQWFLSRDEKNWNAVSIQSFETKPNALLVKLKGYDSPETAKTLSGAYVGIQRKKLPTLKPDEYYWSDLAGLTVIDQQGVTLGTVDHLLETGSNDVLIVKGDKTFAIPYLLGEVITQVDLEGGKLYVNWEEA